MRNILIFLGMFLLTACYSSNHYIALYKDVINKEAIIAIFPLSDLTMAMENCESTVDLYKADDQRREFISPTTGQAPVYYCREINNI